MKLVTFGKSMAPFGIGDSRLVSDEVAQRLQDEHVLSASEDWPTAPTAPNTPIAPARPERPILKPQRPRGPASPREVR